MADHSLEELAVRMKGLIEAAEHAIDMADEHGGMGFYTAIDRLRAAALRARVVEGDGRS